MRREIALIGDTMNTTARILEACRDTDNRVLASAALIERLATLPPGVTRHRLGEFPVRGKERRLELDVLEAEGPAERPVPKNLSSGVVAVKSAKDGVLAAKVFKKLTSESFRRGSKSRQNGAVPASVTKFAQRLLAPQPDVSSGSIWEVI